MNHNNLVYYSSILDWTSVSPFPINIQICTKLDSIKTQHTDIWHLRYFCQFARMYFGFFAFGSSYWKFVSTFDHFVLTFNWIMCVCVYCLWFTVFIVHFLLEMQMRMRTWIFIVTQLCYTRKPFLKVPFHSPVQCSLYISRV